ncbi:MAG TPA: hypothetical protein VHZ96_19130 [Frankiaceae bacterium]|jgi:hypothetical protein|nr:hypothetical protein [Frankiaceae bacterium]
MFSWKHHHGHPERPLIDVWLNPSAGQSVSALAHALSAKVHLVVVPKTGSRLADIAVFTDPDPAELEGISRVLPNLPLLATTRSSPSASLLAAARRSGARLLTNPTAAELLEEITLVSRARS